MKQLFLSAFCAALAAGCMTLSAAVSVKESPQGITVENDYVKFQVIKRGGKIISLVDKATNRDLLAGDSGVYAGVGKVRDVLGNSLGMMIGSRKIAVKSSTPEKAVIETVYTARGGLLDGVEIIRNYVLTGDAAAVDFTETYRSKVKNNRFAINWHSRFMKPGKPGSVVFSSSNSSLSFSKAIGNRGSYLLDRQSDFLGFTDSDTGRGVLMQLKNKQFLDNYYVWALSGDCTLEANFRSVALKPIVGTDEWSIGGRFAVFAGSGRILAANNDAVLTLKKAGAKKIAVLSFVRDLGKGTVTISGSKADGKKAMDIKVGSKVEFEVAAQACKVTVDAGNKEFVMTVPAAADLAKQSKITTKLAVKQSSGFSGFYYYFPELYVSRDVATEIMYGLQGDFRRTKNFRLAVALPPGLNVAYSTPKGKFIGEVTINGKKYRRYEFNSFRKTNYHGNISSDLVVTDEFKDSEMYIMAVWDGGEQTPEKIPVKLVKKLPELGKGLQKIRLGLGVTSRVAKDWQVPQYQKIGVNLIEYWEYHPTTSYLKPHPDGVFTPWVNEAAKRNIQSFIEVGTAFPRNGDALRGGMKKELGTLHYPTKTYEPLKLKDIQAINHLGKPVMMVCPSNRGRYYQKTFDLLRVVLDYGFKNIAFDEEEWSNAATVCYCQRCKGLFKEFLKKNYPNIPYQSPEITANQPGIHKELEDAWWDFKTSLVADAYRGFRELVDSHNKKTGEKREMFVWLDSGVGTGKRYGAITSRLTDYRKLAPHFDWIAPMFYNDSSMLVGEVSRRISQHVLHDTRAKLVMGLCPNRYYEYYRIEAQSMGTKDVVLEQILESIFNGARGAIFWSHRGGFRGAHDFRNMALAAKMLMPVEDILWDGKLVEMTSSNPAVTVTAWKLGNEYAVFLRNYDAGKVRTVLNVPAGLKVVDTLTDKIVSNEVILDESRVKVLKLK